VQAEKLLEKLERYEQQAYDGGFGSDWLEEIGEGFRFYVADCIDNKRRMSISGFAAWIDEMAKNNGK